MNKYAKLVNKVIMFPPKDKDNVSNYYLNEELLRADGYKPYEEAERDPDKKYHESYKETKTKIKQILTEYTPEEYYQEKRAEYDQLTLTPSDVERVLYYGMGMNFDDLMAMISSQAPQVDVKGLAIEFRANNFYRGAMDRNGNRIIDMIGTMLGLSEDDLDYLFLHKTLPDTFVPQH